jgi:internalin A
MHSLKTLAIVSLFISITVSMTGSIGHAQTFLDLCIQKNSLPKATQTSISAMLSRAGTFDCRLGNSLLLSKKSLTLQHAKISDLSPIATLSQLEVLKLDSNDIQDLSPLVTLTQLKTLTISNNPRITSIEPLAANTQLESLDVSYLDLKYLYGIESLSKLKELYARGNQIGDLTPFASPNGFSQLNKLDLSRNRIEDIFLLKLLPTLEYLSLSDNDIADLNPLGKLTLLKELNLSRNLIVNPSPISNLKFLEKLSLSNNQIRNAYSLVSLSTLNQLFLSGNPIAPDQIKLLMLTLTSTEIYF